MNERPAAVGFTIEEAQRFYDEWRFNCGPSALCAVSGKRPEEALLAMPKFLERGYTNPKMMAAALTTFGIGWRVLHAEDGAVNFPKNEFRFPEYGLVRVQWAGPWTKPGVPVRARYRHSHWIAVDEDWVFDINCMCAGGWVPFTEWSSQVVPWLLNEVEPKASGEWWATHCWQIERRA
jgi:hypothetical protein